MASVTDDRDDREQSRIEAARAVVYDDDELVAPADVDAALEAHGVKISTNEDGTPHYSNVPEELSLRACFLAVDTRRDPAEFIAG